MKERYLKRARTSISNFNWNFTLKTSAEAQIGTKVLKLFASRDSAKSCRGSLHRDSAQVCSRKQRFDLKLSSHKSKQKVRDSYFLFDADWRIS